MNNFSFDELIRYHWGKMLAVSFIGAFVSYMTDKVFFALIFLAAIIIIPVCAAYLFFSDTVDKAKKRAIDPKTARALNPSQISSIAKRIYDKDASVYHINKTTIECYKNATLHRSFQNCSTFYHIFSDASASISFKSFFKKEIYESDCIAIAQELISMHEGHGKAFNESYVNDDHEHIFTDLYYTFEITECLDGKYYVTSFR